MADSMRAADGAAMAANGIARAITRITDRQTPARRGRVLKVRSPVAGSYWLEPPCRTALLPLGRRFKHRRRKHGKFGPACAFHGWIRHDGRDENVNSDDRSRDMSAEVAKNGAAVTTSQRAQEAERQLALEQRLQALVEAEQGAREKLQMEAERRIEEARKVLAD